MKRLALILVLAAGLAGLWAGYAIGIHDQVEGLGAVAARHQSLHVSDLEGWSLTARIGERNAARLAEVLEGLGASPEHPVWAAEIAAGEAGP